LKELEIVYEPLSQLGPRFFRGLAKNRSIKKLSFYCCNLRCGDILLYLIPFFTKNQAFESLDITYLNCSLISSDGRFETLEYALEQFTGLKELTLISGCSIGGAGKVVKALSGHVGLTKIVLIGVQIGMEGYKHLADLLQNPRFNLSTLSLNNQFDIDDNTANIISSGLNGNNTLIELDLSYLTLDDSQQFTAFGWNAIFGRLNTANCRIQKLGLHYNYICDSSTPSLVSALSNNTTLKELKIHGLRNNGTIAPAIIQLLASPQCLLESLHLGDHPSDEGGTDLDDAVLESLTNALANNSHLRELILGENTITSVGYRPLIHLLQRPSCRLESLALRRLTDETVESIAVVLSTNTRLRELELRYNSQVSSTAWQILVTALRHSNTTLERLGLRYNPIDSHLMLSLTDLLANNRTLTELSIGGMIGPDPSCGNPAAFTCILYDTSNILNTYNSNHTVEKLCEEDRYWFSKELTSILRINKENDMNQAARIKIIKAHFSGPVIDTQVFTDMKLNVLPSAIAWMGRGGVNGESIDLLFSYFRSMPSVCDPKNKNKKRKAVGDLDH
jgi:hypothetical protein